MLLPSVVLLSLLIGSLYWLGSDVAQLWAVFGAVSLLAGGASPLGYSAVLIRRFDLRRSSDALEGVAQAANLLAVYGIVSVLLVAYAGQFALNELPCPLCMLQRVAFVLAMFGFSLNVRFGSRPLHYAVVLTSACFGMLASGRQILLHVIPGDPGYGSRLLGLHYYTWAFVLFAAMLVGVMVLLSIIPARDPDMSVPGQGRLVKLGLVLAVTITVANMLTTFAQCGPIECADDPVTWWIASSRSAG